jgi:hypothetical protein
MVHVYCEAYSKRVAADGTDTFGAAGHLINIVLSVILRNIPYRLYGEFLLRQSLEATG